jgi:hypothetical protein
MTDTTPLRREKIIYSNRGGKTPKQLKEIFVLEIQQHLRQYPTVQFLQFENENPKRQDDGTYKFVMLFRRLTDEEIALLTAPEQP